MATENISSWAGDILPKVPGVPWPGFIAAVRDAAIEFCRKTIIHSVWLDRISIVASTAEYSLTLPSGNTHLRIWDVDQVFYKENGADDDTFTPLDPESEQELERSLGSAWRFDTAPQPSKFIIPEYNPYTIRFKPIPTVASASGVLIRVNVVPLETATALQDWLYYRHKEAITAGALAELFGHKAAPYYDPNEAQRWRVVANNAIDNMLTRKITGATKRPLKVRFDGVIL